MISFLGLCLRVRDRHVFMCVRVYMCAWICMHMYVFV